MFADQVAEAHKEKEEPSMLRRALRAIMPDISKENMDALKKQQNNPNLVDAGAEPQDELYDINSPLPDGIDKTNRDELVKQQRDSMGGATPTKRDTDELIKLQRESTGYKAPAKEDAGLTDAIPKRTKEGMLTSVYGDPTAKKGKRDIRAEAAKQYAFLNNRDFDLEEALDDKNEYAADLFTPTPDNKTGRQQLRVYHPDRIRAVDVAHALLQRDPEMDKVLKKISPAYIKSFGGEDKVRYFLARHAVGGYSADEENEIAHATDNPPLKELAYLREYAKTGKTVSPVGELKKARGQS